MRYGDVKLNIVDTPGHADFGGEVERALTMVDGVLLLVDAAEGPQPQTRFVLRKTLEARLPVILVINKVDRPDARIAEVIDEVYELFLDLDADHDQIEFPIVYANGRAGWASLDPAEQGTSLKPLFELLLEHIPAPTYEEGHPLQALVTNLDRSPYLGRLALCRIRHGRISKDQPMAWCKADGTIERVKITELSSPRASTGWRPTTSGPGEIISVAGLADVTIGETLADAEDPRPLPVMTIDEPSLSVTIGVNTGPLAGQEGTKLTARQIKSRLDTELVGNVSLRVLNTERPDTWEVPGRGELQLAVLVETMRREGFELIVGKPQVVTREIDGKLYEPVERLSVHVPDEHLGTVTQLLATRKGRLQDMVNHGTGWVRMEYLVPGPGPHRVPHRVHDRDPGHGHPPPRVRGLRAVARPAAHPDAGQHRRRPAGRHHRLRPGQPPGAGRDGRRPRRRGLRGHDRGRELPVRRHGRQPGQGEEAHQHAGRRRPTSWCGSRRPARCRSSRPWSSSPRTSASRSRPSSVRLRKAVLPMADRRRIQRRDRPA